MTTRAAQDRTRVRSWIERLTLFRAIRTIIILAALLVAAGGLLVRLFEPHTFTSFGLACWWAVTTVTTVGYGDVVPVSGLGRLVGATLMLAGVSLIPLVTSVAVSILTAKRSSLEREDDARRQAELAERLDRIEAQLRR